MKPPAPLKRGRDLNTATEYRDVKAFECLAQAVVASTDPSSWSA